MNDTVLMVMSIRDFKSVVDSNNSLDCEKIIFRGYTEYELCPLINNFIKESNFKYYFICSDDCVMSKQNFDLLKFNLQFFPIVSGWGIVRQNNNQTTISNTGTITNLFCKIPQVTWTNYDSNKVLGPIGVYYDTHEINKLPNFIKSGFTGWFYTGMSKKLWEEYPFQVCEYPSASSDMNFSLRVLKDGKYDQTIVKKARGIHISNLNHIKVVHIHDVKKRKKEIIRTF
jgi:hypothetical protein